MFEELVAATNGVGGGGSVAAWARVEAAACARRLAGMVKMLDARRAEDGSADREQWYLDNWAAVTAEIGAAQQITSGAASHQLLIATALRDRLPKVGAVFLAGLVSYRVVAMIVSRTMLIKDPAALRAVDCALAAALQQWEPMSTEKLAKAIDYWVDRWDPHAVRRTQNSARSRCLDVHVDDGSGTASVWGTLLAADGELFNARLDELAATTCAADPRTKDQRRGDAVGAIAVGADRLACQCGQSDCTQKLELVPASGVVVHVVVNDDTLDDEGAAAVAQDAALDGDRPPLFDTPVGELTIAEALRHDDPGEPAATRPAAIIGGPVLPGSMARRLAGQAIVKKIVHPGQAPPESRYKPSAKLAEFVRCRDLTCRFPGCDVPATKCDVDHTIAYPLGPTAASNLKSLCRFHHLLKTFWGGADGWRDRQSPDGTVVWTGPGGQSYTTRPGSRLLFPALCRPTAPVAGDRSAHTAPATGLTMPRRNRSRAEDRARRIDEERLLNEADQPTEWALRRAERQKPAPF